MTSPFLAAEVPLKELTGDELRARVAQAQMFLIYMKPTDRWSELAGERQLHLDHLRYLYKLEEEGRLFGAGPVDFQPGQPVEGLAIIVAASRDAAEQVAANEPFNKAGARARCATTPLGARIGRSRPATRASTRTSASVRSTS